MSTTSGPVLADVGEDDLLARIFPRLPGGADVLVPPGDDTALLSVASGSVLITTDAMVRGRDWLDEWSSGADVGAKAVAQNLADIAAMGGVPTGVVVTLLADPQTSLSWVEDLAEGLGAACRALGVPVLGGDLSSAGAGTLGVSVTALGSLQGRSAVLRSGAGPGDVLAVAGSLGRSAAGWLLLQRGTADAAPELVGYHRRPCPPYSSGPDAAAAGATSMIDISDGLVRDAGRVALASGVRIVLDASALAPDTGSLAPAVGEDDAWECVLSGGEEHSLLATFPARAALPSGWRRVGRVDEGQGVQLPAGRDGGLSRGGGWDHFGG